MARQNYDFDLVIIGGGSAGIVAGNVAGAVGARVALVEKERIGGECLWTGCVPSKALLHVARVAHTLRHSSECGLPAVALSTTDYDRAFDYVRQKIEEVKHNDATEKMLRDFGVELFFGPPRFVSPHVLRTPHGDLKAAQFLLAMGSLPAVPPIPGLETTGFLTNKTLYDLTTIPHSLTVIGGGYIACEMGQALARLGCRARILVRGPRLLEKEDAQAVQVLESVLRDDGVQIETNAEVVAAQRTADGKKTVAVRQKGREGEIEFESDEILVSTGRKANTNDLNLDDVSVRLDEKGNVIVDRTGRTTARHIWACGDVTGQFQFSHMAEHEAKILVRNILFPGSQAVPFDVVPWATFTEPEIARVGLTEAEAKEKYGAENVQVLRHDFRQDDRAIVENRTAGFVKVLVTGLQGRVVGACIVGPQAGELIHEWVLAMRHNLPVRAIADLIHVYPTLSVSNQRAAQRWYGNVMNTPLVQKTLSVVFNFSPRKSDDL